MSDIEVVHHYVSADREIVPVVYSEDNPLWILVGLMLMAAMLVIVAVLGAFFLAGVWLAGRIARWAESG